MINNLAIHEETKTDILNAIYIAEANLKQTISNLEENLEYTKSELNSIRKMHEHEPIMPFYDTVPSARISVPDNVYELNLAVQGKVEQDAERPVVIMSVREYGHPKNFATQVWVDKFSLLMTKDRKLLISSVLEDMRGQMVSLFDKEEKFD